MTAQHHEPQRSPAETLAILHNDRSPKTIRAALPPGDRDLFDREYRSALDHAKVSYDLTPIKAFQDRWWATAVLKADPAEYDDTLSRAEAAMEHLNRGDTPPGAVPWDDDLKARMQDRTRYGPGRPPLPWTGEATAQAKDRIERGE
ncbi:DUF6247 family protein [Herbidospora sp. RD11066]